MSLYDILAEKNKRIEELLAALEIERDHFNQAKAEAQILARQVEELEKRIAELEAAIKQIEDITLWAHDFRKSGELLLKIRAVCYGITQKTKTDTAAGG